MKYILFINGKNIHEDDVYKISNHRLCLVFKESIIKYCKSKKLNPDYVWDNFIDNYESAENGGLFYDDDPSLVIEIRKSLESH